jgi:hypothetical protein
MVLTMLGSFVTTVPANAASSNPAAVCVGSTCTVTFTYTGDYYLWSAPLSGSFTLEVWGAQGGGTGASYWGTGGNGGYAKGTITLTSGQNLYVYPGQQGFQSSTSNSFNGGGKGNPNSGYGAGWTGGGATHIATASGVLSSLSGNTSAVKIVAGGGGGAGGSQGQSGYSIYAANGGAGGGSSGIAGSNSNNDSSYRAGGGGGTQASGGTSIDASVGASFGYGADASTNIADAIQGGGGGGGWYGGGSGMHAGGGGGGGSGYVGGVTSTTLTAGNATMPNPSGGTMTGNSGNGVARITYTFAPATVSLSTTGNANTVAKGQTLTLTATSDSVGKVTFFVDGKRIAGCISLSIPVGTQSCTWKAAAQKISKLTAMVVPGSGAGTGYSSPISVFVTKRTGLR